MKRVKQSIPMGQIVWERKAGANQRWVLDAQTVPEAPTPEIEPELPPAHVMPDVAIPEEKPAARKRGKA